MDSWTEEALLYLRAAVHSGLHGGQGGVGLGCFADVGVEFSAGHVVPPARLQQEIHAQRHPSVLSNNDNWGPTMQKLWRRRHGSGLQPCL